MIVDRLHDGCRSTIAFMDILLYESPSVSPIILMPDHYWFLVLQ